MIMFNKKTFLTLLFFLAFIFIAKVAYADFGAYWEGQRSSSTIPISTITSSVDPTNCSLASDDKCESFGSMSGQSLLYTPIDSNTIKDEVTFLTWQKEGSTDKKSWGDAGLYCYSLVIGSIGDWRLPTFRELLSLQNTANYNPAISTTSFPGAKSDFYWSSTTYKASTTEAYIVSFADGSSDINDKALSHYVRCVKSDCESGCTPLCQTGACGDQTACEEPINCGSCCDSSSCFICGASCGPTPGCHVADPDTCEPATCGSSYCDACDETECASQGASCSWYSDWLTGTCCLQGAGDYCDSRICYNDKVECDGLTCGQGEAITDSDPRNQCSETTCTDVVKGWNSNNCESYESNSSSNGMCKGGGVCYTENSEICEGAATIASCGSAECKRPGTDICEEGEPTSTSDTVGEICYTSGARDCDEIGGNQHVCNSSGTCYCSPSVGNSCASGVCVVNNSGTTQCSGSCTGYDLLSTGTDCGGLCQACSGSWSCSNTASNQDYQNECAAYNCTALIKGWSGNTCQKYSGDNINNGNCLNGACRDLADSCTGGTISGTAVCGSSSCKKSSVCIAGSPIADYDTVSEVCHTLADNIECATGKECDDTGACIYLTFTVSGNVTDKAGDFPLSGVDITYYGQSTVLATTNSLGSYNIYDVNWGNPNFTFSKSGYNSVNRTIEVHNDETFNMELKRDLNQGYIIVSKWTDGDSSSHLKFNARDVIPETHIHNGNREDRYSDFVMYKKPGDRSEQIAISYLYEYELYDYYIDPFDCVGEMGITVKLYDHNSNIIKILCSPPNCEVWNPLTIERTESIHGNEVITYLDATDYCNCPNAEYVTYTTAAGDDYCPSGKEVQGVPHSSGNGEMLCCD